MVRGFALTCLALAVFSISSVSSCGGRTRQSRDESSETPTVEELVLAKGTDLRFEAISGDGSLVAYSSAGLGGGREICVVATEGGEPERLGAVAELDSGRFDGTTLLLFRGDGVADGGASLEDPCSGKACGPPPEEWSPELLAWRPNDPGLTSLALDVDPGSVRFSRDGRWISLEANDPPHPDSDVPDILLVDTRDLSVRRIGAANLAPRAVHPPIGLVGRRGRSILHPGARHRCPARRCGSGPMHPSFIVTAHVLASAGSGASPWMLTLYDAAGSSHSLGEITGPFGVEPGARRFFVTTRASAGQSTLVLGWLRL